MTLSLRIGTTIVLGILSTPGVCRAQSKSKPPDAQPSSIDGEVHGTPVKKTPPLTDDDIALLAPRPATGTVGAPKTDAAAEPAAKESATATQEPEKRKAEIAALEQQIKEKQRRIQLLMRMFVIDEQAFLRDPSGQSEEDEARAKRQFEQEELLQEGKDIARLRARLAQVALPADEKPAPAKGVTAN